MRRKKKVHSIVAILLIGLATATRPPYGGHSAKAQVGKAILVRIPLDSDTRTAQQQYQGDYHEPTPSTNNRNRGQYQTYGYEAKDEPETRSYPESKPVETSHQVRPQGYGSYRASSAPEVDPRQKVVLLVPDANKETSQSYPNQQSNSNYAPRQPNEDIVYSKPLSPSGTKLSEKKNQYQNQNANKEHHKVPLILITLNKEEKLAVKAPQTSRRIPPGYGKSWQPMITESRSVPAQQDRQNYEAGTRLNQQATYNNEWQQGQPIRQESFKQELTTQTTGTGQWQASPEVQYEGAQRNPQSTDEAYDQWKPQTESATTKTNYNGNNNDEGGRNAYGSQQTSYTRPQEQPQISHETYPQQYPRSYQTGLTESSKPLIQTEQQSYQGGYYQREPSTGNQQESNYQGNQDSKYPQQVEEPKYTQTNVESRYPQQSHESRYQQSNPDTRYPQQSQEGRYQQTNPEIRYPQQRDESKYQQANQESRYPQTNQESRYQEQRPQPTSYKQTKTENIYPVTNQENRYPQQTQETRYPQQTQETRYPQQTQETRYPQQTHETRYPQQSHESRYTPQTQESRPTQTSQEIRYPQANQETRYAQTNPESRYQDQTQESRIAQTNQETKYPQQNQDTSYETPDSRYAYNQPSTGNNYAQNTDSRHPQESSIGHGSGYTSQTSVRANQDQPQTKQETINPAVKTQWRQASSYVPEQVEPTRTSEDYEKPVRESYNQGYTAPQSAGPRAEDSWEPQATSERTTKTRAERTKGVVLLLLSNDDKDGYARRSSEAEPIVPSIIPSAV